MDTRLTEVFLTHSPEETEALGEALAAKCEGISAIAMTGGLGAGKTALTRGIARYFGTRDSVASPTYAIVNEYRGRRRICHFDFYRLDGEDALYDLGWDDYLTSGSLIIAEWSERAPNAFPPDTMRIAFEALDDTTRRITVTLC